MSINIGNAQKKALSEGFDFGGDDLSQFGVIGNVLEQYGALFLENIDKYAKQEEVTASGALLKNMTAEISDTGNLKTFTLKLLDYFDYPNEGVKGVDSSKNAPDSPYQYKTYGMPPEALGSLKKYILSGKAKIASVKKDKALGIGSEKKGLKQANKKTLIERQVATMAYMIKKYGIKATHYFDLAFEETFSDFDDVMTEALGEDVQITIDLMNKKYGNN
jgi:hypothetical protein